MKSLAVAVCAAVPCAVGMAASVFAEEVALSTASDAGEITVNGQREKTALDHVSTTASRLGLSIRETPAMVETLTQEDMQRLGLRTQREAYENVVGAISGNNPGNPAVVTMRGFGNAAISIMHDGVRISTSTMVTRDTNTWHFEKIEVIKGPASVLYGEGALAGVINKVTRKPDFNGTHVDGLLSYGSFDTLTTAAGVNLLLSDTIALRFDASNMRSDSLYDVDNHRTRSSGLTGSLLFKPSADLSVLVAIDHYDDRYNGTYQGMPMISADVARDPSKALRSANGMVLDKAIRHKNYNLDGAFSGTWDTTYRARVDYALGSGWSIADDLTLYRASRDFVYIGAQVYTAPTAAFPNGSLARSAQDIVQEHDFWNNRLVLANDSRIAGHRNRFSIGVEYNRSDFFNPRKFSPVGGTTLIPIPNADIFNPQPVPYPTDESIYTTNIIYDTTVKTSSAFLENAFNLTPEWLIVGGLRYDHIDLERIIIDHGAGSSQSRGNARYNPISWRVGLTYDVTPDISLYGQYTTAVVPVSAVLIQPVENTRFDMTKGRSYEVGFKAALLGNSVTVTGAAYRIEQDDILTRDPDDFTRTVQGGKQSSQGAELSLSAKLGQFSLSGGIAYSDARLDELLEAGGANRAGNRPINTPTTTVSGAVWYTVPGAPLTLGGMVRHVSGFYTDTANTYFVRGRTTFDASFSYRIAEQVTLTIRGRNLTDAFYGEYSGYPVTSVYIGAPRSFEAAMSVRF